MIIENPLLTTVEDYTQETLIIMSLLQQWAGVNSFIKLRSSQRMRGTHRTKLCTFLRSWKCFMIEVSLVLNCFANPHTVCLGFSSIMACRISIWTKLRCPECGESLREKFLIETGQLFVGKCENLKLHFYKQSKYFWPLLLLKRIHTA